MMDALKKSLSVPPTVAAKRNAADLMRDMADRLWERADEMDDLATQQEMNEEGF